MSARPGARSATDRQRRRRLAGVARRRGERRKREDTRPLANNITHERTEATANLEKNQMSTQNVAILIEKCFHCTSAGVS